MAGCNYRHHDNPEAVMSRTGPAATQRPVAEPAFSEPTGFPAWRGLPSWAVVATADKAAGTDVVRSMAERAGATITEVESSHVVMVSQPQAVTDVILEALAALSEGGTWSELLLQTYLDE
jgi:pimeloyl-ACP methyl ester carboxylesterase